jgi:copper chaperone NosL
MTIIESKFAAELVTTKGKTYKFDDAHCVVSFLRKNVVQQKDIAQIVFTDHDNNGIFLDAKTAFYVVSPNFKSPMNSNAVAFSDKQRAGSMAAKTGGVIKDWKELQESIQ